MCLGVPLPLQIVKGMADTGTRFLRAAEPFKVEPSPVPGPAGERRLRVHFRITRPAHDHDGGSGHGKDAAAAPPALVTEASHEDFDTVVFATGRAPVQVEGAREAGLALSRGGKVVSISTSRAPMSAAVTGQTSSPTASEALEGRDVGVSLWSETSTAPSVHAVGDVLEGRPELTPVAIQAGRLLARRIVAGLLPVHRGGSDPDAVASTLSEGARAAAADAPRVRRLTMDYALVPTTVFTPLEYGCIGLAEEEAAATHGGDGIEVFHLQYDTLELALAHRADEAGMPLPPQCYAKLITTHGGGDPERQRVIGLHVLGPSAGEVIQGFAVALRMGATKAEFDACVGIHPTHAEEVVGLDTTKRSGASYVKTSC
jgi:pyruvate/2-oxoglutarate dehydrogenase complex dihydrolipoamide dehydrogenase (E3) component